MSLIDLCRAARHALQLCTAGLLLAMLAACSTLPPSLPQSALEQDVNTATQHLIDEWRSRSARPLLPARWFPRNMLLGAVVDQAPVAKPGFALPQSQAAERTREFVAQYLRRQAPEIRLVAADASPGLDVRAAIAGQLAPTSSADVLRLTLTMLDIRSGEIMARVQGDVHTAPSDLFPTSFDSESPVLVNKLPGQLRTDSLLFDESTKGVVSDTGVHGVVSDVWLAEAQLAYGAGHYEEALDLYKQAVAQPSVNAIRAYNGMYLSLMRLDRQAQATEAFKQLVAAGLSARSLGIKLLFVPGQTEFLPDPAVRSAYASWLQIIGSKVNASGICLDVVGHTSHTGTETFNLELSLMRGERVRDLLQADVPQLFTHLGVIGKGWTENIVGSGTDDARDAVDRRVEFRVVDCQGQSS